MGLTGGQKFCLGLIVLGALAILAGSASPFWIVLESRLIKVGWGVWYGCADPAVGDADCDHYNWNNFSFDDFSAWFYVFHATAGLATLLCLVLLFLSLAKMCGKADSARSVGSVGLTAGIMGITAAVVFYVKTADAMDMGVNNDNSGWGFYVFISGSGFLALCSIVILALPNSAGSAVSPYGRVY